MWTAHPSLKSVDQVRGSHSFKAMKLFFAAYSLAPLVVQSANIALKGLYFENYAIGDVVTDLGNGITVQALQRISIADNSFAAGNAIIFDSEDPAGDDRVLGTANEAFGYRGGKAGRGTGIPMNNKYGLGKALTVHDQSDPDDNKKGGIL
jgi:hypothetical protein